MKCQIPEISWHNRDPVLSVDIQPINKSGRSNFHRLASGGSDTHVLIWHITYDNRCVEIEIAADLTRHQRAVNVVRWSPSGELLASGDDESVILIWKQKEEAEVINMLDYTNDCDKEIWLVFKILRGHMEDVYDLSWAPNSIFLISGSVDNTAIIWDVLKGKQAHILQEATGFVQGVAWDPKNKFLATLSTDRCCRVYDSNTKKVLSKNSKCQLPFSRNSPLHGKICRLFHDDTLQTFFRRLSFSPDGMLLVAPSGVVDDDNVGDKKLHTTYIYARNFWRQPAIVLPSPDQYTVVVKFSPLLYKLRQLDDDKTKTIPLPYRMVFAVATKCSIFLYDTQQQVPFGTISNIHYTRLTDLAWSNDGKILFVSSTDGFCSVITFGDDELGEIYSNKENVNARVVEIDYTKTTNEKFEPKEKFNDLKVDRSITLPKKSDKLNIEIESLNPNSVAFYRDKSQDSVNASVLEKNITIEIPADKIIRSDEKFESHEQKNKPVTPISVRRHQRARNISPESGNGSPIKYEQIKLTSTEGVVTSSNLCNPTTSIKISISRNSPTPIAVRRHPRTNTTPQSTVNVLIPKLATSSTMSPPLMDAWPFDDAHIQIINADKVPELVISKSLSKDDMNLSKMESEDTANIKLVYDEDVELIDDIYKEEKKQLDKPIASETPASDTPKQTTPRRVEFRTISTPKSKKRLL